MKGNGSSQTDAAVAAVAPDCRTPMSEGAAGHLAGGAKEYAKRAELEWPVRVARASWVSEATLPSNKDVPFAPAHALLFTFTHTVT